MVKLRVSVFIVIAFIATGVLSSKVTFAQPTSLLNVSDLFSFSSLKQERKVLNFSLRSPTFLFKSGKDSSRETVNDFLSQGGTFDSKKLKIYKKESDQSIGAKLIPDNFANSSSLIKQVSDENDDFFKESGFNLKQDHFYYQQYINNIPVYGSFLSLHIKNKNELKTIRGKLISDYTFLNPILTEKQARQIALVRASSETSDHKLEITNTEKFIINKKLMGLEKDDNNYLTLAVSVRVKNPSVGFFQQYFVDLTSGKVIYVTNLFPQAINREILFCPNGEHPPHEACYLIKDEKHTVAHEIETENFFSYFGDTYNVLKREFKLDSYDNKGHILKGYANVWNGCSIPHALGGWTDEYIFLCQGMVGKDIVAHEVGHGVSHYISKFNYTNYNNQAGAINESISDIIAYLVDPDWIFGEDIKYGIMRRMDDPTVEGLRGKSPDRLFSSYYICNEKFDWGGVHYNSGILNKTFYLMVTGGAFNGCKIDPIGKSKSTQIIYRLIKNYLDPKPNYKDIYEGLLNSCDDLYGSSSATCQNLSKVLQATEIDQQDTFDTSPKCKGIAPKIPQCAFSSPTATVTPTKIPTITQSITPHLSPTKIYTATPTIKPSITPSPSFHPGDGNKDGRVDGIDYLIWLNHYGTTTTRGSEDGDYNTPPDGKVDGIDYVIWLGNYK